jgi:hypothetical protein
METDNGPDIELEPDPKAYVTLIITKKGPLPKPTMAADPCWREPLFVPLPGHSLGQ